MRLRTPDYMYTEAEAEALLTKMRAECGDKIQAAEVRSMLPDWHELKQAYMVVVHYFDPARTPIPVRFVEVYDEEDYQELVSNGCVHNYSVGTTHRSKDDYNAVRVECTRCHGECEIPYPDVIRLALGQFGGLNYDDLKASIEKAKAKEQQ